jgi:hypothetical protein
VWGNKLPKELEDKPPPPPLADNTTSDVVFGDKGGGSESEGGALNGGELTVETPPEGVTFGPFPAEERDRHGFAYFKQLASLTETFLNQPISESEKLTLLQEAYSYFRAKLQRQGEKMGIPPDELL